MWKNINGRLIQMTDPSRVKFRTNISKRALEQLTEMAGKHDTHVNYLLETGMEKLLDEKVFLFNKANRPKDRIQYKTTYDKDLLDSVRAFAKAHDVFINDVIEYSTNLIDIESSKEKSHKYRTEKG